MMSNPVTAPVTVATYNRFLGEHRLMGTRCTQCGGLYLPPRAICPACYSDAMEWVELAGRGTLAAFTSIYIGPSSMVAQGYDRNNPYISGIVTLEEGVRISARLLGLDAKHPASSLIGTPLVVEFLDQAQGEQNVTTLAFKPASGME
jgi:uncharacterized protein